MTVVDHDMTCMQATTRDNILIHPKCLQKVVRPRGQF